VVLSAGKQLWEVEVIGTTPLIAVAKKAWNYSSAAFVATMF
jgi:hypothetical protein